MFDRRLRIILIMLGLAALGLAARAGQIQLIQGRRWSEEASDLLTTRQFIETVRGRILDRKGRELAVDQACMDACVDYPAITDDPDEKWLREQAVASARRRYGSVYDQAPRSRQRAMVAAEVQYVRGQIALMWTTLAEVSGKTPEQIDEIRRAIVQRVEMRRQYVSWQNYQKALARRKAGDAGGRPWYTRWLPESSDAPIDADTYAVDVAEQTQAHVVLPAISADQYNELAKRAEDFPGLVLRPGQQRLYPFHDSACHIIGRLAPVSAAQIVEQPDQSDPLSKYWPNDLAGQSGVEAICEQTLRGRRGELTDQVVTAEPVHGRDVTLTIDIDVQSAIERSFAEPRTLLLQDGTTRRRAQEPGAAVVIDIPTGQVLAMVSYPTYDLNEWDRQFPRLRVDDANAPLLDRATEAYEPGSSVKPMMGLAALHDGIITPQTTIECTGYLVIDGHRVTNGFKCWTMSEYGLTHHDIPPSDPLPSNSLTVSDAIERSCNVFFETVADRMGMVRQRYWYDQFGLGRPTGIGLPEASGRIPNPAHIPRALLREYTWFAGIGQGPVLATPIQMANAMAAIARGGIWMRPTLLDDGSSPPAGIDLGFSPEALAAVRQGMWAVVNRDGGTMKMRHNNPPDEVDKITLVGKTGTPQAPPLTVPVRDASGQIVMEDGHEKRVTVDPNSPDVRSWYTGEIDGGQVHYAHAWFVGYAPAEHPRIAIAVFVEYGQYGGTICGPIVRDALAACVRDGYLSAP
ncbi:MAG TPA: penicillin-binding transpeptidase domain-containing protein [Tepidisphaeraceae bacterium]|nr:penicillin-binding transpeptidase domain-containing protein [Tepidisphaeraceae bacterium]